MAMNCIIFWIMVSLLLLIVELGTPGLFFFISFACGALGAAILAMLSCSFFVQAMTFVSLSIIVFFIIRLLLKRAKFSDVSYEKAESNYDALIGKKALVIKDGTPSVPGRVKIGGEEWPCLGEFIIAGETVRVVSISGNKVIVKKDKQQ